MGIGDRYDRTKELIAVDAERQRQAKLLEDMRKAQAQGGQGTTTAPATATPATTTPTPSTPATPAVPTATSATTPAAYPPSQGGTEAHWEDYDDIQLPDPDKDPKHTGWGAALGLLAPVASHFDADYSHDSHFGQHLVPAQPPTTPAMTPTAATPTTPAVTAAPAVQAHETPAVAAAPAVGAGAHAAATHHELAAPGTRPRERSIDGTDPTDVIAHLDDQDLEDLASLLFDRLQTRLRRDLIVGRERSGFLTDFR
jgi:hypothetical protein